MVYSSWMSVDNKYYSTFVMIAVVMNTSDPHAL